MSGIEVDLGGLKDTLPEHTYCTWFISYLAPQNIGQVWGFSGCRAEAHSDTDMSKI